MHRQFKSFQHIGTTLRHIMGEDLVTHIGLGYHQDQAEAL